MKTLVGSPEPPPERPRNERERALAALKEHLARVRAEVRVIERLNDQQ